MAKFLTLEGLTYYNTGLKGKFVTKDGSKVLSDNNYTTSEKNKLAGIATGAAVNTIENVQVNGTALPISSKAVNIDLSAYALKSALASVYKCKGTVATYSALPTTNEIGDVYNITAADAAHNINAGDNVVWTGTAWDNLSGIVNLSAYVLKTALATVATTGSYSDLSNKPVLSTVATSGKYSDLTGAPTSLPANGGNASALNGKADTDFVAAKDGSIVGTLTISSANGKSGTLMLGASYGISNGSLFLVQGAQTMNYLTPTEYTGKASGLVDSAVITNAEIDAILNS